MNVSKRESGSANLPTGNYGSKHVLSYGLILESVTKRFRGGNYGVRDVSLNIEAGVLGLLGLNGAGKSTLMQMIATITRTTCGRIRWNDIDIVRDPDSMRRRLGYLPQDFGVYDNLTAIEFLSYFAALKGVRNRARIANPSVLPALLIGIVFVAAAATSLGVISSNAKTFILSFLSFWYVVINDKGVTKSLDFAGFFGTPLARLSLMYLAIGLVLAIAAQTVYVMRLRAD